MSDNETGKVTMRVDGHVCTITMDNQAKKNAFTPAMLDRLAELLTDYEDNDELWVATASAQVKSPQDVLGFRR